MTTEILIESITGNVLEIVATLVTLIISYYVIPAIKNDLIPWLKEKHIYETIKKLVKAAEKMAETNAIEKGNKKAIVISLLKEKGIEVTTETEMLIETAVKELDIISNTLVTELKKETE